MKKNERFSSPSGDGLVLQKQLGVQVVMKFSSPSGVGLVPIYYYKTIPVQGMFSSPLGDGLARQTNRSLDNSSSYFRPRVGMGWFDGNAKGELESMRFSSPSGDGLVQRINVRQKGLLKYFRPRLGLGWFLEFDRRDYTDNDFRPHLGMGWF